ncbi:hypothetical protein V2E24_03030 [Mycoplasmopsis ciconiae]|uniref:Lipoprotein n=1 Tax=Mycoplasmopsis ciconiae TaxID=561067 RepID=A0ABU7MNH6_9BACT|nr:hypothetical protein [Mycoplasmopsis ciconiae]
MKKSKKFNLFLSMGVVTTIVTSPLIALSCAQKVQDKKDGEENKTPTQTQNPSTNEQTQAQNPSASVEEKQQNTTAENNATVSENENQHLQLIRDNLSDLLDQVESAKTRDWKDVRIVIKEDGLYTDDNYNEKNGSNIKGLQIYKFKDGFNSTKISEKERSNSKSYEYLKTPFEYLSEQSKVKLVIQYAYDSKDYKIELVLDNKTAPQSQNETQTESENTETDKPKPAPEQSLDATATKLDELLANGTLVTITLPAQIYEQISENNTKYHLRLDKLEIRSNDKNDKPIKITEYVQYAADADALQEFSKSYAMDHYAIRTTITNSNARKMSILKDENGKVYVEARISFIDNAGNWVEDKTTKTLHKIVINKQS